MGTIAHGEIIQAGQCTPSSDTAATLPLTLQHFLHTLGSVKGMLHLY